MQKHSRIVGLILLLFGLMPLFSASASRASKRCMALIFWVSSPPACVLARPSSGCSPAQDRNE